VAQPAARANDRRTADPPFAWKIPAASAVVMARPRCCGAGGIGAFGGISGGAGALGRSLAHDGSAGASTVGGNISGS